MSDLEPHAEPHEPHAGKVRPVRVRDYMYSRKGAPPIMVRAHSRGLPNSKAADVTPTGAVIGA
jgi:hypothetical protein